MARIVVLRVAMPPVTVVVDSGFACRGLLELGPRRTTAPGAAWAHLWEEVRRLPGVFGGLGRDGLLVRKARAHQTTRAIGHAKL
eukprot:8183275-Pyramimonas_sp.AAC.1